MKNDFKSRLSLAFLWFFSFIIIIFMMCISVHAEEPYFPMQQNENGNIPDYIIDYFNDNYADDYFVLLRWWGHNASFNEDYIYFLMIPKSNDFMVYGEIQNNGYQFSLYNIGNQVGNISNGYMGFRNGSQSDYWNGGQNIIGWQLLNSSLYDNGTDFVSNFKIWTSNNESSRELILKYGSDPNPPLDVGVAILPDGLFTPDLSDIVPPNKVPPTYTPSDYTWTPKPSIDNSSSDALLKSIFGIIEWGMENFNGEFQILKNNLNGWFKYLGDLLTYYLNGIVESINAGIQNFYENMANLVQPIYDKFSYITEPLDLYEVETALNSSTTYSFVTSALALKDTYQNFFNSISAPSTLSFHIPYIILTQTGYIDFNFSWYADIRDSVLPWIVGFLYMGFGLALFRSFPSIIHGVSGILQKGG